MLVIGIDSGSQNTKGIALENGRVLAQAIRRTEFDTNEAATAVYEDLLAELKLSAVAAVVSTGTGRKSIKFVDDNINEIRSAVRGVRFTSPAMRLIIDLGAEACRVIKLKTDGQVDSYEVNDKCASGVGTFIETMARALQVATEDMGSLSLKSAKIVPMNAQCVVFAESEVVSLIHQRESKEDIACAIHTGVSNRINSMVRRVGMEDGIILIGGTVLNTGLAKCLRDVFAREVFVPENAQYISALGAALHAAELAGGKTLSAGVAQLRASCDFDAERR
ncbi:MAG: acyl-CoA dehydratase activase [Desulfovibrio sp.]|jgi:benzoyl-CoA reductase subunit D|nr:acyl-CoA dehydratase activase [Desulfovibrio sp.]